MKALVLVLALIGCACPRDTESPESPVSPAPPVPAPAPQPVPEVAPAVTMTHVVSAWGSTGVVATNAPIPYWAIAMVDARASAAIEGLALTGLVLLDAEGRVVATCSRELELRVVPEGRPTNDYSTQGTTPFDGRLPAGTPSRLWVHGRLDDDHAQAFQPVRYRATFQFGASGRAEVEADLGSQWPTG